MWAVVGEDEEVLAHHRGPRVEGVHPQERRLQAIEDGLDWFSANPEADAEETMEKQKEIEAVFGTFC